MAAGLRGLFRRKAEPAAALATRSPSGAVRAEGTEHLDYTHYASPGYQYRRDAVAEKVGLSVYRTMQRDPIVISSLRRRVVATFPGYQVQPAGADDRAARMAALVSGVCSQTPGGFLQAMQTLLLEGETFGFAISELVPKLIQVEGIGPVRGLAAVKVRPSETFENGFDTDRHGNILRIRQTGSEAVVTPDQVALYIHDPIPGTIEGTSILFSAHDAWKARTQAWRAWQIYLDRMAGGLAIARAPGKLLAALRADLESILEHLQTGTRVILPKEAEIERLETSGQGGVLYKAAQDFLKAEIRAAILGTEDANATISVGSYARTKAQQDAMYAEIQADSQTFAEWIREALFTWILRVNGYDDAPPLCVPESKVEADGDPVQVLDALGRARTTGALTIEIPQVTQVALVNAALQRAGLEAITPEQVREMPAPVVAPTAEPATLAPAPALQAGTARSCGHVHAAGPRGSVRMAAGRRAPAGRTPADISRMAREWRAAEARAAAAIADVWRGEVAPAIVEALDVALWNRDGTAKTTNWAEIRAIVEKAVRTKGATLHGSVFGQVESRFREGVASAWRTVPDAARKRLPEGVRKYAEAAGGVKAKVTVGSIPITPAAAAEALKQDVYIALAQYYAGFQEQIYYVLRDGILARRRASDMIEDLYELCESDGMTMSRAVTLVNTELSRAFAEGRQSVYSQIETADTLSTEEGAIIGYESVAVLDDNTTPECYERDGLFFTVGEAAADPIPRHYNCRSTYVPLFAGEEPWTERGWWDGSPLPPGGFQRGW